MVKLSNMRNRILFTLAGTFLFCFAMNFFVTPVGLYSNGILGISQIIRTVLKGIGIAKNTDISGIINMMFNIPLFILAFKSISKDFFFLTVLSVACQTVLFAIIPTSTLLVHDILTNCVIGGILAGAGCGLVLRSSASAGGLDILGYYLTGKFKNLSVGKIGICVNCVVFALCMYLFSIETAIYSIIYCVVFGIACDKIHTQNISVTALIFTRYPEMTSHLMKDLHRGVTFWEGYGAYTRDDTYILVTAISKYEVNYLKKLLDEYDENAFVILLENNEIIGNFEKHL